MEPDACRACRGGEVVCMMKFEPCVACTEALGKNPNHTPELCASCRKRRNAVNRENYAFKKDWPPNEVRHIPGVRCPVQGESLRVPWIEHGVFPVEAGWVPWAIAEIAYKAYVKDGHGSQSLETLAARGGFGWAELISCLRGSYNNESAFDDLKAAIPSDASGY